MSSKFRPDPIQMQSHYVHDLENKLRLRSMQYPLSSVNNDNFEQSL